MKTCRVCKTKFNPSKPMQTVCGHECALSLAKSQRAKKQKKEQIEQRKIAKEKLDGMKTRSKWIAECQAIVNRIARLRDMRAGYGCISCGEPYQGRFGGAFDAGHYRSIGSAPHLRFFLPQINLQCVKCNRYLGGNSVEYRRGLIERKGLCFVEKIESMNEEKKWTIDYLKRFKSVMSKRARRLERRLN